MKFNLVVLFLFCMCYFAHSAHAANPDILWQKALTADTLPIRSIAIAEGKYVAALKGSQIIILDYATGDSIKSFTAPKEMYGNDIILGKGGERLYVLLGNGNLRSWDIATGVMLKDVVMDATKYINSSRSYSQPTYIMDNSLDGKRIAVMTGYTFSSGPDYGGAQEVYIFNTVDSVNIKAKTVRRQDDFDSYERNKSEVNLSKSADLNFSPSGNYLQMNVSRFFEFHFGGGGGKYDYTSSADAYISSFTSNLKTYHFTGKLPFYTISSGDDFLLSGNKFMDLPPTHSFRTLSKIGFVFLPDDNHMLALNAGGGIAAISNIEKDTWEKVFYGDSLPENLIQTNASRSAFATATSQRITLWKIPDTLESATLTANFTISKDTIQVYDSVTFTNTTFPFKRGSNFEWNFGDATPKTTTPFPVHTFTQAGTFTVTLTVRDTLGATSSISKTVFVDFPAPKALFMTISDTVFVGNVVVFSNQTTPVRLGTHFSWNFGDGSAFSSESSPGHQFFSTGNYTVSLIVRDTLGRLDSFSKQIVVISQIIPSGAAWINHFHTQRINSLAYSPDGQLIISGSNDRYSRIWEGTTGKQLFTQNVGRVINSTLFSIDSKSAMVASYQIVNSSPIFPGTNVANMTNYMDVWYFSQSQSEQRIVWNIKTGISLLTYLYINKISLSSSLSPNNKFYLLGTGFEGIFTYYYGPSNPGTLNFGEMFLYNVETGKSREIRLYLSESPFIITQICPNNLQYVILEDKYLFLQDIVNDSIRRKIPMNATSMRFSPDKYHLLTNTGLWDIYDSILVQPAKLPQVFEFHPDGIHVFTVRPDSTIGIYNLNSNSYDYLYPKQPRAFSCLAVAPDGKHIATGDNSGYITVWKVPDTLKSAIKIDFHALSFKRNAIKTSDTVEFANTTLPVNNSFDYSWNFGDGTTSTERAPKHRYLKPGKFTVSLTAYSNGNVVDSITKMQYITVTGPIGVDESQAGLSSTALSITPNPSYGETQIHITLAQASDYNVRIMDNLGREIARWEEHSSTGEHVILWNENVLSGVYYCMLSVGGEVRMVPFVVVR